MMGWLCFNISGAQAKDVGRERDNGGERADLKQ